MRRSSLKSIAAIAMLAAAACGPPEPPLALSLYYGDTQRVGHLGAGQRDYNVLGETSARRLTYSLNGGREHAVTVSHEPFGFRRLGGPGHFNVDVALTDLRHGRNDLVLRARHRDGSQLEQRVVLDRVEGSTPLPFEVDWSAVTSPESVGWCVDGLWSIQDHALRSAYPAYDRLFAVGDESWRDYEVRTCVTVHAVAPETGPYSGGNGLGIVFRFQGHTVGGPLDFPEAQPKWGYLPFGAITWLRWRKGAPGEDPSYQFYRGDRNELADHGTLDFTPGRTYVFVASCESLADDPSGAGRTRYRMKVWDAASPEPSAPAYEVVQVSQDALRSGGFAFVAHHVDASFGDLVVRALTP